VCLSSRRSALPPSPPSNFLIKTKQWFFSLIFFSLISSSQCSLKVRFQLRHRSFNCASPFSLLSISPLLSISCHYSFNFIICFHFHLIQFRFPSLVKKTRASNSTEHPSLIHSLFPVLVVRCKVRLSHFG